jgi:hypothetical protein
MSLSHPINPSEYRLARPRAALVILAATFSAIIALPQAAHAQSAAAAPRRPPACGTQPERHGFDFWLGEWDVTTEGGTPVGSSVIQSVSRGCALLENWTASGGGQGKSLNAYNPQIHQWQQFWIGADGGVAEFRSSKFDGSSLVFFRSDSSGTTLTSRLTFTPIDSATVRQHSETTPDGGKSWVTQYDFYYHRRPGAAGNQMN